MAARQIESDPGDRTEGMGTALKRRGLIAGAAALVAGIVAKQTSQPVAAGTDSMFYANGSGGAGFFTLSSSNFSSGVQVFGSDQGVWGIGYMNGNTAVGVRGDGGGGSAGVLGYGGSDGGAGVQGTGAGAGSGVYGTGGNTSGIGVQGLGGVTNGTGVRGNGTGAGAGVYGAGGASSGIGVQGLGGSNGVGVRGDGNGTGSGVEGRGGGDTSGNTTGFPIGVRGSIPNSGYGVYGNAGIGAGVYGTATNGVGTEGIATTGTGVLGQSSGNTFSKAIYGHHTGSGYGVYGDAGDGGYGVTGVGTTSYGVHGVSTSGTAVQGQSTSGSGVYGSSGGAGNVAGGYFTSSTTYGVIGNTTAKGYSGLTGITSTPGVAALAASSTTTAAYAAYFTGTTIVEGDLYVVKHPDGTGGGKFAAVAHADGSYRGVYCTESPEPWFEDFGTGTISGSMADVTLDPEFAALIHTDTYHVFITPRGDFHAHIAQQTPTGFRVAMTTVDGAQKTASAAGGQTFSWRVVGKRKDIAGTRLPKVDLPKIKTPDPNNLPRLDPAKKP